MAPSKTIISFFCVALVLLSLNYNGVAEAFCSVGTNSQGTCRQLRPHVNVNFGDQFPLLNSIYRFGTNGYSARHSNIRTFLVSEENVLEAVERAETLWAEALEARKTAYSLTDRAEEEANASAGTAEKAADIFQDKTTPITMEELVQMDSASKASLDATSLVNKAMEASDEADRLELEADEALTKSEETLDQHLIDFPDSSLAE